MHAQDFSVTGTVTSSDDGSALPGVTILVEGTNRGTTTGLAGNYQISVADENSILVFSFIGFSEQRIELNNRTTIDVILQVSSAKLDEVVVTALGIERDAKSIGYAVQQVPGEDLIIARNESAVNQLAGKVTGLSISETNGGAGSSTRILLRGNNSFTNNNQALIVIDGVPIENSTTSNSEDT